jgi:hypothetical protein
VRALALAAAALALLLACHSDSGPAGKGDGEACAGAIECQSDLCFKGACASSTPAGSCTPPHTPTIVNGGAIVATEPAPGACVAPVRDPVGTPAFVDLGQVPAGSALEFDLPAGTASFTILSQEVPGTAEPVIVYKGFAFPNSVVPTDVTDPNGRLFYSDTDPLPQSGLYPDPSRALAYYGGFSPISGAFTVPNTAAGLDAALTTGELPAGRWRFTVNDFARECPAIPGCAVGTKVGTYRVQVLADTRPFTSTGTLDLEVYIATSGTPAPGTVTSAAQAVTDPGFARWVQSLAGYFAKAGICLGTVSVHDVPAWAKSRYAPGGIVDVSGAGEAGTAAQTLPGCDFLSQLFTVGLAQSRAVHVFLADELVDGSAASGLTVLGVDGSIPGPSGVPGTVNGGAVVGVFDLFGAQRFAGACSGAPDVSACGSDVLALVTAHEAGHWLGLYHTTEAEGTLFDPLGDTETCACLSCAPFALRSTCAERSASGAPTLMFSSYCSGQRLHCGGGRNLMFWLFDDRFAVGDLSRQQGDVMRRNPAVH